MNSSRRRASLTDMYCSTSKPRTAPPKRVGKAATSKRVIGPMPLSPRKIDAQESATVPPTGQIRPRPVITTRRLLTKLSESEVSNAASVRTAAPKHSGFVASFADVIDRLLHGRDLLGIFVRDLDLELLFERHNQLDGIERIGAQVVDERGGGNWNGRTPELKDHSVF